MVVVVMILSERWKKKGEERREKSFDVGVVGKKRKVGVRVVWVVLGIGDWGFG
jgi:hypothetical protein